MKCSRILPAVLSFAWIAVGAPVGAQTGQAIPEVPLNPHEIQKQALPSSPFVLDGSGAGHLLSVEVKPAAEMSAHDRDVEAGAESSIRERAGFEDLEFDQGKWSYEQIVCPALPDHLLLRFTRNEGSGNVSMFSASVPRTSDGRVRIIPIMRRSYSLFSPAPINALTIAAFNHIRGEENPDVAPDWLATGLCYAALAGAHPVALLPAGAPELNKVSAANAAALEVTAQGHAVVQFADMETGRKPMEWTMTFDAKGKLLKATHSPAPLLTATKGNGNQINLAGQPVKENGMDLRGNPVPATSLPPGATPLSNGVTDLKGTPIPPVSPAANDAGIH